MRRRSGSIAVIATALMLPMALHAADSEPAAESKAESKPKAEAREEGAKPKVARTEARCEYVTGSRIRHKPPVSCDSGGPGLRVFSREDLFNTGATDMAEALRLLDPRLR